MRWKVKQPPILGTQRTRTKFLWFPLCIAGECRWWEEATFIERYRYVPSRLTLTDNDDMWVPIKWVT